MPDRKAGPARAGRLLLYGLTLLACTGASGADLPVYRAVVPLASSSEADRAAAFGQALRSVVVRASGRREAADAAAVQAAAASPDRYVQQYAATTARQLKVGFDARAIEQLLGQAGLPLWPAERPVTLVVLPGTQVPEQAEIERVAQSRGMPIEWARSGVDAGVLAAAAARKDAAALIAAAGGTARNALLIEPGLTGGAGWVFAHAGQVEAMLGSAAEAAQFAADSLAARYAPASTRGVTTTTLSVSGIDHFEAYAGVLDDLSSLSPVRSVAVDALEGDLLRLRVTVRGDLELLRRLSLLEGRLRPGAPAAEGSAARADFVYQP